MTTTVCPLRIECPTPDECSERRACARGIPPLVLRPLSDWRANPFPFALRVDTKPRAVWPAGVLAAVAVSALMSACGGDSGDDDTTSGTQPVDCVARPELCK